MASIRVGTKKIRHIHYSDLESEREGLTALEVKLLGPDELDQAMADCIFFNGIC